MTLEAIKQIFLGGGGAVCAIVIIVLTLIQITPIKLNPWSWLGRKIGRLLNGEVLDKVDKLTTELEDHKTKSAEREATQCRSRILRFGDEILHGVLHSHEHYLQILLDIDEYEEYCDAHPDYRNNVAVATIKHIKKKYQQHLNDDSFL
jgi:hypothetical protein